MIILPPAVPIGAAGEKNCVFASNSLFSRPFFNVSAQNFCVIHGNLAAYCVIPPNWGEFGTRRRGMILVLFDPIFSPILDTDTDPQARYSILRKN